MCAAGRENNIELLMLVLDFVVNSRLKNTQWHFCGIHVEQDKMKMTLAHCNSLQPHNFSGFETHLRGIQRAS